MWSSAGATSQKQRSGAPFFAAPRTTRSRPPTRQDEEHAQQQHAHEHERHERHETTSEDDAEKKQQQQPPSPPKPSPQPGAGLLKRSGTLLLSKKSSRTALQKKASFSRIRRGSQDDRSHYTSLRTPHIRAKSVSSVPAGSDSHPPPPLPATTTTIATPGVAAGTSSAGTMLGTTVLLGPYAAGSSYSSSSSAAASAMMSSSLGQPPPETVLVHQHVHDVANKRISTMDYLRKAQEGRVYWFNTLRYDRPDIARMSYFDARRLARRATNYLLLGLSIPAVVDLNGHNAVDLLRSFGALLAEFESFQQLHAETGSGSGGASSLSRAARLPHMFRRATPGSKVRRTSSATASEFDGGASPVSVTGAGSTSPGGASLGGSSSIGGGGGGGGGGVGGGVGIGGSSSSGGGIASLDGTLAGSALTLVTSESAGSLGGGGGAGMPLTPTPSHGGQYHGIGGGGGGGGGVGHGPIIGLGVTTPSGAAGGGGGGGNGSSGMDPLAAFSISAASTPLAASTPGSTSFATYYDNNTDLLPGEEYALLLTPSLPFDPDFFETFATLCDVLIDCYTRILGLLPTPRECTPVVVDLFNKADARVRKLLVQGVVKEFEDHSRAGVKTEVANIGRVVLGGLMG